MLSIMDDAARDEHALLSAIRSWAQELSDVGGLPGDRRESAFQRELVPHLEGLFEHVAIERRLKGGSDGGAVLARWPNVGALDLELGQQPGSNAWVELKWTKRGGELANCAWDAAKLAEALRSERAQRAYLVAGAPVSAWEKPGDARRLFESSLFDGDQIVTRFPTWWAKWMTEGAAVGLEDLPTPIMTTPVGSARVLVDGGEDWEIRVARVDAPGNGRVPIITSSSHGTIA